MKKVMILTVMIISVFVLGFVKCTLEGGALSGTYRCSPTAYITFTGNNFTGAWGANTPFSGTFSVSGSRLTLNITGGPRAQNTWTWAVADTNTLSDQDGDIWRKEDGGTQTTFSGSYFREDYPWGTSFVDGKFYAYGNIGGETGTYSVSGSRITINITANNSTIIWTIVDANTVRDNNDQIWKRAQ